MTSGCGSIEVQVSSSGESEGGSGLIYIDGDLCKGCEICISFCPLKVFENSEKLNRKGYYVPIVAKEDECVGCRLCELLCPEFAIIITNE